MEEIKLLLNNEALLVMLMAPSMIVGMAILFMAYKLINKLGDKYILSQDRQAAAFETIAKGVDYLKDVTDQQVHRDDDIRITLRVMTERLNILCEKKQVDK